MKILNDTLSARTLMAAVLSVVLAAFSIALAQSTEEGLANFYNDSFQGKKMANGELYDKDKLTASHKKHPFGTKLRVRNTETGKTVVVTVTDRMGRKNPAVIDVSRRAAEELGFVKAGKAQVSLEAEK